MVRRDYMITVYIVVTRHANMLVIAVLYIGAGSGVIKHLLITYELQKLVRPTVSEFGVRDASNQLVSVEGTIDLSVNVGS